MRSIVYRGETFGGTTDIGLVALRGFENIDVEEMVAPLPRYHGGVPINAYALSRRIEIELRIRPSTRFRALSVFQPEPETEFPLAVVWEDELGQGFQNERVECRVRRRASVSRDRSTEFNPHILIVELVASDPAIYIDLVSTVSLPPLIAPPGLSYPVIYPKDYTSGGGGSGGLGVAVNGGDWETWPTLKINGPSSGNLNNPTVENLTTGKKIELDANGGVSIAAGEQLIIETHPNKRSILFAAGASRYGRQSDGSEFWPLEPGANDLKFSASGTTIGSSVEVEWRSARI